MTADTATFTFVHAEQGMKENIDMLVGKLGVVGMGGGEGIVGCLYTNQSPSIDNYTNVNFPRL